MGAKSTIGSGIVGSLLTKASTDVCVAKAGAAAGTAICPVVGTIAGAVAGMVTAKAIRSIVNGEKKDDD